MGADKITDRILADAKTECNVLLDEAKRSAKELVERSEASAKAEAEAIKEKAKNDAAENERRRMLTASLDARKNSLSSRRSVLESAFGKAFEELCSLPDDRYAALLCRAVISSDAAGDESVYVASSDVKRFEKLCLIDKLNDELKKNKRQGKLKYAGATDRITSGALLVGEKTDIDCSFRELLSSWREGNEAAVTRLLFGGMQDGAR